MNLENLKNIRLRGILGGLTPPKTLLFCPTESILRSCLESAKDLNMSFQQRGKIADISRYYEHKELGVVGPALGAPAAALVAEPFLAFGTKHLIFIGACGGIVSPHSSVQIGNILFPTSVLCKDATSQNYGAQEEEEIAVSDFQNKLAEATSPLSFWGPVLTTDAPLLMTEESILSFVKRAEGARGVERKGAAIEMELAPLAQLAKLYSVEFSSALVVTDLLGEKYEVGFGAKEVRKSFSSLFGTLLRDALSA